MKLQLFDKLVIDFVGLIQPPRKTTGARYIITKIECLTQWVGVELVKYCREDTTAKFIFEFILSRFGYPKILMSDRDMHFLNETIVAVLDEF